MNRISQLPVGKPMRLMTQAEVIAEFQRRIDDVTEDEATTPRGRVYLALVRDQKRQAEARAAQPEQPRPRRPNMGAAVTYKVRVLRLVEDEVEVSAITPSEAEDKALEMRGVARVLGVVSE